MYLTKEEEKILSGEYGPEYQKAMKALVKLGEAMGAERLVNIVHAHISGISYRNIGDAGLEFIEELSKVKVKVFSTCNPAGFDLEFWKSLNIPEEFFVKQLRIINALSKMGVKTTCTCTPYYVREPSFGEHLAWGESSAVLYANTVYGARTNREGGPSSLFSALIGKTPYMGMHLSENRKPRVIVDAKVSIEEQAYASTLGFIIGDLAKDKIPYVKTKSSLEGKLDLVKAMCAGVGTSSPLPMCIVENVSPEAKNADLSYVEERIHVEKYDLEKYFAKYSYSGNFDVVFLGCPHLSLYEVVSVWKYISKERVKAKYPVFLAISRHMYSKIPRNVLEEFRKRGIRVLRDTCLVVAPLDKMRISTVATNSIKHAYYLENIHGVKVRLCKTLECLKLALGADS